MHILSSSQHKIKLRSITQIKLCTHVWICLKYRLQCINERKISILVWQRHYHDWDPKHWYSTSRGPTNVKHHVEWKRPHCLVLSISFNIFTTNKSKENRNIFHYLYFLRFFLVLLLLNHHLDCIYAYVFMYRLYDFIIHSA